MLLKGQHLIENKSLKLFLNFQIAKKHVAEGQLFVRLLSSNMLKSNTMTATCCYIHFYVH